MNKPKALFCWSGGKDSSYCLHKVLSEELFDVVYLLTTINDVFKRVSMHGVREKLLEKQTESIRIPLLKVKVSQGSNEEYEKAMELVLLQAKLEGITHVIFGDIFLEDLRVYRENNLEKVGLKAVFPLWKLNTTELVNSFVDKGFKTITCCTNNQFLGEEWVGREVNQSFIDELPKNVDPCGENGEFHTFCYAGPIFKKPIEFEIGEKIFRPLELKTIENQEESIEKGFWFCDLIPQ